RGAHVRATAGPGHGKDVVPAVVVAVEGGDAHAPAEADVVREEVAGPGTRERVKDRDFGPATGAGAHYDLGLAVAAPESGRNEDATGKASVEGEEPVDEFAVEAAVNFDVGSAARSGADDDVGLAVAVHVSGGHVNAAPEPGVVGEEIVQRRAG